MPVGLSIVGERWSEAKLLSFAFAYEQRAHGRARPTYAASVEGGEAIAPALRGQAATGR
jgi:amidase